jgi:sensor histidine kinase regulating citrate/malate metabolism
MPNDEGCAELERLLRIQRHDFINHLQVVHALLQLGKTDRAMSYIEDLAKDHSLISDVMCRQGQQTSCQRKASE